MKTGGQDTKPATISITRLNKAFESRVRLGVMSVLMVNDSADFTTLKQLLELTDGNLSSHTRALEELGYISCEKRFIGRKPNTVFSVTDKGREAFQEHLSALEKLIGDCDK
ncbi:MAG: transcriptional regulator [Bacteroidales bacterium]|nr:transcriptional regulator [Bacteroidales bacterium]